MSTRKRTNPQSAGGQPLNSSAVASADLPPTRPKKRVSKGVQPPLANMSLTTFIYGLVALSALYLLFQTTHIFAWKAPAWAGGKPSPSEPATASESAKAKVHEFVQHRNKNSAVKGESGSVQPTGVLTVEQRINELADALGMPGADLARAIAVAVREYVPPASLSSVSAAAKETGGSQVIDELLGDDAGTSASASSSAEDNGPTAGLFERVVGMDEPPSEEV